MALLGICLALLLLGTALGHSEGHGRGNGNGRKGRWKELREGHHFWKEYNRTRGDRKQRVEERLTDVPLEDYEHLHVDEDGEIFYQEPNWNPSVKRAPEAAADLSHINAVSGIPQLHSRPGATHVLYLDFDGESVPIGNSAWTENKAAALNAGVFSVDIDTATMSSYEASLITAIWRRVSEDYSPWNIDVTTVKPTTITDTVSWIVVSGTTSGLPGGTGGGIAYVGVHGRYGTLYRPGFCYPTNLRSYDPHSVAECISHEAGHNMGLNHDGEFTSATTTKEYFAGVNNWGPIMGAPYSMKITQWSKGEYTNANNKQDDLTVISGVLPKAPVPTAVVTTAYSADCNEVQQVFPVGTSSVSYSITSIKDPVYVRAYSAENGEGNVDLSLYITCTGGLSKFASPDGFLDAAITFSPGANVACTVTASAAGDSTAAYSPYGSVGNFKIRVCNAAITKLLVTPAISPPAPNTIPATTPPAASQCCLYTTGAYVCAPISFAGTDLSLYNMDNAVNKIKCTGGAMATIYDTKGYLGASYTTPCNDIGSPLPTTFAASSFRVDLCTVPVLGALKDTSVSSAGGSSDGTAVPWWGWTIVGVVCAILLAGVFAFVIIKQRKHSEIV